MCFAFDDNAVSYDLTIYPEDTDVRGNVMVSGDDDYDKECEDAILADLANGNDWAWCTVKVTARYEGVDCVEGMDWMCCCSYRDRDDFETCGYYDDMKHEAREALYAKLERISRAIGYNGCDAPQA